MVKSPVPFGDAVKVWARIAALSFGGPAGQIAVMHRILIDEKRWIGEQRFLHALNFCMLLPGPEAQQLATYIGWLLHGVRGGLVAGVLFVLPGALAILALSWIYVLFGDAGPIEALFFGLKAAVVAIVVQAVVRIGVAGAEIGRGARPRADGIRRDLLSGRAVSAARAGGWADRLECGEAGVDGVCGRRSWGRCGRACGRGLGAGRRAGAA